MASKKKETKSGKTRIVESGASILEVVRYMHEETVAHCEYCGKPMSRSDVNDYGSLCERCYMKEYYGE